MLVIILLRGDGSELLQDQNFIFVTRHFLMMSTVASLGMDEKGPSADIGTRDHVWWLGESGVKSKREGDVAISASSQELNDTAGQTQLAV